MNRTLRAPYMTTQQVAEMLGVAPVTIRRHVQEHGLTVVQIMNEQLRDLKEQGVLPPKTTVANLLPPMTVTSLVKIVRTPEAHAIWKQAHGQHRAISRKERFL